MKTIIIEVSFLLLLGLAGCAEKYAEIAAAEVALNTAENEAHRLFTEILQLHVKNGRVNYAELRKDKRLEEYLSRLSATDPETIPDQKNKLAFWLNAYNAFTLKIICDNYPLKSINDLHFGGLIIGHILKKTVWDKKFIVINDKNLSLNYIEHHIIRAREEDSLAHFSQVCLQNPCPRAHFALVCASKSCPNLRAEAYEGYKLDEQLDEQAREFFNTPGKNYFEAEKKTAHLNKILDWFEEDFGENEPEILLFIAQYLPGNLAEDIRANPSEWKIKYTDYNWSLNE